MPCAELYERYLANGWQAKENCPDLKPVNASTFGRVIEKVFPNVTKTKRRTERGKPATRVYLGLKKNNYPLVCDVASSTIHGVTLGKQQRLLTVYFRQREPMTTL